MVSHRKIRTRGRSTVGMLLAGALLAHLAVLAPCGPCGGVKALCAEAAVPVVASADCHGERVVKTALSSRCAGCGVAADDLVPVATVAPEKPVPVVAFRLGTSTDSSQSVVSGRIPTEFPPGSVALSGFFPRTVVLLI